MFRLRHWFPGAGDPWDWPVSEFEAGVAEIDRIERYKRNEDSALDRVEDELERAIEERLG